jgi:hypothetical protein
MAIAGFRLTPSDLKQSAASAAILLFIGIPVSHFVYAGNLNFYYYVLLRLVVCFIAAYCAYLVKNRHRLLFWIMVLVAFLFNPIILAAFLRPALVPIDLIIAFFFLWVAKKSPVTGGNLYDEKNRHIKPILIAGCVALAIDVSIVGSFSIRFGDDLTLHDRINEYLGAPAWLVVKHLAPEQDLFLIWWGALIVSALFYGFIVWLILSFWSRVRTKDQVNM